MSFPFLRLGRATAVAQPTLCHDAGTGITHLVDDAAIATRILVPADGAMLWDAEGLAIDLDVYFKYPEDDATQCHACLLGALAARCADFDREDGFAPEFLETRGYHPAYLNGLEAGFSGWAEQPITAAPAVFYALGYDHGAEIRKRVEATKQEIHGAL